ncbi:MAG: hypothetical protein FWB89_01770 [Treponema sp.]|nr:hypothetical protein [Treponema sp.]
MKIKILSLILCFIGVTAFSQNMSYYTNEYMRGETFVQRLNTLQLVRNSETAGAGQFYHDALKYLLLKTADIRGNAAEQAAAERSLIILSQGLGDEKYKAAAGDLWNAVEFFDVVKPGTSEGNAMQAALIALAHVDGREFIPHIVKRLDDYNTQIFRNAETRRRYQTAVIGCINALETFKDASGYRPVFFTSVGSYDPPIKQIASSALPNITNDPANVLSAVIRDSSNTPDIKLEAWNQMLRSKAPDQSKARVAAVALATGWNYATSNRNFQTALSTMRKSAIEGIRQFGVSEDSVYINLDKSFSANFTARSPDRDEIMVTLNALAAVKTDEAVVLLTKFTRETHERRLRDLWTDLEREILQWLLSCISVTGTRSADVRYLLITIQRTEIYTPFEQGLARSALTALGY